MTNNQLASKTFEKKAIMTRNFIILILMFISVSLSAQTYGGIKAGLNLNDMIITTSQGDTGSEVTNPRYSFHAGSFLQHRFSDHFSWRIEMLFSNKGYSRIIEDQKIKTSLNYLNWPIMLVYAAGSKLELEAGLEPGYMVSGEQRFNTFDLGVDIGARYNLSDKFNIGLRYNLGFPFQFKTDNLDFSNTQASYQQSVFQFSIGYNLIRENASEN